MPPIRDFAQKEIPRLLEEMDPEERAEALRWLEWVHSQIEGPLNREVEIPEVPILGIDQHKTTVAQFYREYVLDIREVLNATE